MYGECSHCGLGKLLMKQVSSERWRRSKCKSLTRARGGNQDESASSISARCDSDCGGRDRDGRDSREPAGNLLPGGCTDVPAPMPPSQGVFISQHDRRVQIVSGAGLGQVSDSRIPVPIYWRGAGANDSHRPVDSVRNILLSRSDTCGVAPRLGCGVLAEA